MATQLGRPVTYNAEFAVQAQRLCNIGATDDQIADYFGVSVRTLHRWKHDYDDFCHSISPGKDIADDRVERSLYQKAVGYDVIEEQAIKLKMPEGGETVEVVEVRRHVPASDPAAIFWLKNRRKALWRDRHEVSAELNVTNARTIDPRRLDPDQREMLKQLLLAASAPEVDGEFTEAED